MKRLLIILQISFILILPLNSFGNIGNDATSFNPLPISVEAKAGSGVPIGTVIAWPVSINPPNVDAWLDCKGQSISRSTYPELYAIVGSRIPNYQGIFLRGYGGNSSSLGTRQGDAIRNMTGNIAGTYGWEASSGTFTNEGCCMTGKAAATSFFEVFFNFLGSKMLF